MKILARYKYIYICVAIDCNIDWVIYGDINIDKQMYYGHIMDIRKKIVANQSKYIAILNYRLDTVTQAWQNKQLRGSQN